MPHEYERNGAEVVSYYVPEPMYDWKASKRWNGEFRALQRDIRSGGNPLERLSDLLQPDADKSSEWSTETFNSGGESLTILLDARELDVATLKSAHARLLNRPGSDFRKTAIWIGAATPASSTMVAPKPERLNTFVPRALSVLGHEGLCPLLKAVLCSVRLLHLHPFDDGNGRLTRLLGAAALTKCGVDHRSIEGIREAMSRARGHVWLHENYLLQQSEDWDAFLAFAIRLLRTH